MGRLSTHVLDTAKGIPAKGVSIDLYYLGEKDARTLLKSVSTNADGRTDEPLLSDGETKLGTYELVFHIADYFRTTSQIGAGPAFLDSVPIRFSITDANGKYHVPLVCSPWSYSTYRGS
jgi:5-hydroxyisourate hydrolase